MEEPAAPTEQSSTKHSPASNKSVDTLHAQTDSSAGLTANDSKLTLLAIAAFLLIGVHFNFSNTGGTGLEMPYNAFGWIFISLIIGLGLKHISDVKVWHSDNILRLISVIMIAICVPVLFQVSLITPQSTALASTRILGIFTGLLITLIAFQCFRSQDSWHRLLTIIAYAGLLEAILCLVQQFLPEIASLGVYKPEYGRPFGTFQQPNVSASFIATGLACSLFLTLNGSSTKTTTKTTTNEQKSKRTYSFGQLTLHTIIPFFCGFAILLLGSRTGVLSTLMVIVFTLPFIYQTFKNKTADTHFRKTVCLWFGSLIIGIAGATSTLLLSSESGRSLESIQTTHNRENIYTQAFDMISDKPLTGWGYGNFEYNFLHYYAKKHAQGDYQHAIVPNLDHPHNELLLWAVEGGTIPAALLIALMLWLIFRAIKQLGAPRGLMVLALILPLSIHANTEYPFYQSIGHWLVFCLLTAWLIWSTQQTKSSALKFDFFVRCFAWVTPFIAIPVMVLNLQAIHKVTQFHANKKTDFRYLSEVVHPSGIWKRFFFDVMTFRLIHGLKAKDPAQIKPYISWAEGFLLHTPRVNIYFNLANAYWAIGQQEQALEVLKTAAFLYPKNPKVHEALANTESVWIRIKNHQAQKSSP
ncbi:PglL family O-oligosaccharyltransferase [Litoribacillus peritrichatus]|uniref:PglL family O-oligosaccharyltransferase n=1 Tax=Litoribacillus peritrichatus TaxID=718191 RepID=A0ABP7MT39_9GAMM